eukprot:CAMPEP_0194030448 /NCGR_PEP_ID=MMETSP0009_2-20130614/3929_1 /TAXON_ID=210454 /ORGANISM="Grammatophora oceanica, Strain CCMP 410" /LENGTH=171 /DNA_ID=CAMNT_0038670395 /DNA_START=267 /DNA_END=782 /DNA_ORIENTATION=+
MAEEKSDEGPTGCYLVYEADSGGKLVLYYSQGPVPENAVGFWCPAEGKKIQGFKFKQNGGRSELIKGIAGGDSNRRKYFSGWCQFIKAAYKYDGKVIKFPNAEQGVEVDVYALQDQTPVFLELDDALCEVSQFGAIAVVPKHNVNFQGVKTMAQTNFLDRGNLAGATTHLP